VRESEREREREREREFERGELSPPTSFIAFNEERERECVYALVR
jgi:hypothetical protein